ncbi:type I-E CRISPR-associated protein Cas6/Cse3/CasE [Salinactinospora qingdaonensis]|uniref:Type I-E CRISPR-associated protein Cas6/Cse3/CasE n=1 Tax=Salinactinospora qingdaonensis TaxID=702744 RepID=A0ABP7GCF6_9ACTN
MDIWLTQIAVHPQCTRLWRRGLLDGDQLHRELMHLVPDGLGEQPRRASGLLYRAEITRTGLRILAQTCIPPQLEKLSHDFVHSAQQRCITGFLATLHAGMRVRYRIAANPTKRHGNTAEPHKRGKLAHLHGEQAELWWLRKATNVGLHPLQLHAAQLSDIRGTRDTRHGVTQFDGTAMVTDPQQLHTALIEGIGRAKTYGCGMLSLGPTQEHS